MSRYNYLTKKLKGAAMRSHKAVADSAEGFAVAFVSVDECNEKVGVINAQYLSGKPTSKRKKKRGGIAV